MISLITNRKYFVEPIGYTHTEFGDINPATKKLEGSYGNKYRGSIDEEESMITPQNGFEKIHLVEGSPFSKINEIDKQYQREMGL